MKEAEMKRKSYIKAGLSAIIWGLGQLFNKQYLKALFFFAIFALFITVELSTSNYFYEEKYENEIAFNKIPGKDLGDSFFEQMPLVYYSYLNQATDKELVRNEHFENYLNELGVIFYDINGVMTPIDNTEKLFTEQRAIEFLAKEFKSISPLTYTNLRNHEVYLKDGLDTSSFVHVRTRGTIYYNENNNKFYLETTYEDEDRTTIREYTETNLILNQPVENPEKLNSKEGLIKFAKTDNVYKYNNDFYLKIEYDEKEKLEVKYIKINYQNDLIYYNGDLDALEKITLTGPIYINETDLFEYYEPALQQSGVRMQYKESTIMYTFRRMMDQSFRTPGNNYRSQDIEKLLLKIHFELNPEIKDDFVKYYNNFFYDKAGIFLKGYWSVATLGVAKKQDYSSYMALTNNIVGRRDADYNLREHVSLVESTPIQGHISTMLLIEGLIAVLLSFFFFIFMIWSVIDAFKVSEQIREKEKVSSTKEYFKSVWDNGFEYIVLSPALFVLAFISIMPILFGFIIAFTSISGNQSMVDNFNYVGLKNFVALFNFSSGLGASFGKAFWNVLSWTIIWAIFSTFTVFFGGFIQALILNSEKIVFRKLWRTILILPWAIPALLSQMVFSVMFKETGFINQLFRNIGLYDVFIKMGILGKPFSEMRSEERRVGKEWRYGWSW